MQKNCRKCNASLTVKDITRRRITCLGCRSKKVHPSTLTIERYRALKISECGTYTFEDNPSEPSTYAEFVNMIGGIK